MATKKKPPHSNAGGEDQRPSVLPAVVIADSLEVSFRPLTCDGPKCLLPVCGVPLILHAFDFLKRGGVGHVILVTSDRNGEVEAFVKNSTYCKTMRFEFIQASMRNSSLSLGDILRQVDANKQDLATDFILMYADTICTADLPTIIQNYSLTKASDPNWIMTKLFTPVPPTSRFFSPSDDAVVIFDETNNELVAWDSTFNASDYKITRSLVQRNSGGRRLQIRHDLCDFGVSICSASVLRLFSESFDHMSLRRDFCREILQKSIKIETIYVQILSENPSTGQFPFAIRTSSPRMLHAASCAVMERVTYPVILDAYSFSKIPLLTHTERGVYRGREVSVDQNCDIGPNACLLAKVTVCTGTCIKHSVVGKNCSIGSNCDIRGSIILDNVRIGNGVVCKNALVGSNVTLNDNVRLGSGCQIGSGVVIDTGMEVPPKIRLATYEVEHDSSLENNSHEVEPTAPLIEINDNKRVMAEVRNNICDNETCYYPGSFSKLSPEKLVTLSSREIVGANGVGIVFPTTFDVTNLSPDCIGTPVGALSELFIPKYEIDSDDESLSHDDDLASAGEVDVDNVNKGEGSNYRLKEDAFTEEIRELIHSGLSSPHVLHHKLMEAKSFRLACGKSDSDLLAAALVALLDFMKSSPLEFTSWIADFEKVNAKQIFESTFDDTSETQHMLLFDILFEYCQKNFVDASDASTPFGSFGSVATFGFLLQVFARLELVDDEYTLQWHLEALQKVRQSSVDTENTVPLRLLSFPNLMAYIDWLADC